MLWVEKWLSTLVLIKFNTNMLLHVSSKNVTVKISDVIAYCLTPILTPMINYVMFEFPSQ